MEKMYAQALWTSIANGKTPKDAVHSLVKILERQGRAGLMPRIQRAFVRLAEANRSNRAKIMVAREKDAKHAMHASGAKDAEVIIDETIIGGWRYEGRGEIIDRSFKKYLLDIYTSSIQA